MRGLHQHRRALLPTISMLAACLLLSSCAQPLPPSHRPPNIVIILTDDQGYADVGVYGATGFETPNLDRLAAEGMRFSSFYVSQAVCSASRASLMTGCYAERVGIQGALGPYSTVGLDPDEETIAEVVKAHGYETGIFGKWHLGHQPQFLPQQHGFDEFLGLPYSNDMWPVGYDGQRKSKWKKSLYPELPLIDGEEKVAEIRTLADQDTLTTRYTERAVAFIEENKDRPFLLYVPHSMPHVPLGVSDNFRGKSEQGMYGDVMMEIDWSVGRILEALEENGLTDHTLVIYVSDNGPWLNFGNHAGSAGMLREGKGTMWEGGARVPCLMRWPGKIKAGAVTDEIAATIDILPTVTAVVGATLPGRPIDGVNLEPLLLGDTEVSPRSQYFYYYEAGLRAVREGRYKLLFPHQSRSYRGVEPGRGGLPGPYATWKSGLELYDLEADPGETEDLAAKHPEIVARLSALAAEARAELGDRLTGVKGKGNRSPGRVGSDRELQVEHFAIGKSIDLKSAPSPKYAKGGPSALLNGTRGTADFSDGSWLGFEVVDLYAVVDLGRATPATEVTLGFLRSQLSWIFLPRSVEVSVSTDGTDFETVGSRSFGDPVVNAEAQVEEVSFEFPARPVRYVRVEAQNVGACPEWHPGAGGKSWLFIDEIELR